MDGLNSSKCQKSRKGTHWEFVELLIIIRRKMNSIHLLQKDQKMGSGWTGRNAVAGFLRFLERESTFSRYPADRTVGFRRSKK